MISYIFLCIQILCAPIITGAEQTITLCGNEPHSFLNRWGITKPQQWNLTLTQKVAQQFETLDNILTDNSDGEKKYVTPNFWAQKQIAGLFKLADQEQTNTTDSIINSPDQLIECIALANILQAKQSVKEKLLESQHAETLIHIVFTPAKNQNENESHCDHYKNFIISTLEKSPDLKKRFEPIFYRLVYTCPEWIKANKELESVQKLKKRLETNEYNSSTTLEYLDPIKIDSIITTWQQSEACTVYNNLFNDELKTLCMHYCNSYTQTTQTIVNSNSLINIIDRRGQKDFFNRLQQDFFIKDRSNIWIHIPFYRVHLPLLSNFINFISKVNNIYNYDNIIYHSIICKKPDTAPALLLDPVDIEALNQYEKKQLDITKKLKIFINNVDPDSIISLQLCHNNNLQFNFSLSPAQYSAFNNHALILQTSGSFEYCSRKIIDPDWRIKIIAPWIAMGIGAVFGYFALRPLYKSCVNYCDHQKIVAHNNLVHKIESLHLTGAESSLIEKIESAHSIKLKPILSSSLPKPIPQPYYSEAQIENSFRAFLKIKTLDTKYVDIIDDINFEAKCVPYIYWACVALCAKAGYYMYKKIFPTTKLFNPIKAILPLSWIHYYQFNVPAACSLYCITKN